MVFALHDHGQRTMICSQFGFHLRKIFFVGEWVVFACEVMGIRVHNTIGILEFL